MCVRTFGLLAAALMLSCDSNRDDSAIPSPPAQAANTPADTSDDPALEPAPELSDEAQSLGGAGTAGQGDDSEEAPPGQAPGPSQSGDSIGQSTAPPSQSPPAPAKGPEATSAPLPEPPRRTVSPSDVVTDPSMAVTADEYGRSETPSFSDPIRVRRSFTPELKRSLLE
jgi:hypothetical protein